MSLPVLRENLDRRTRFSFACSRCLACCRNKRIQVNPYEIARLARNRGLATSVFTKRYTRDGGAFLKWNGDGSCVFLGPEGCGVHPDRPLVCRLYPLGRHLRSVGEESFSEVARDPECRAVSGEEGKIGDYLVEQGALPFIEAADAYLLLFLKLFLRLQGTESGTAVRVAIDGILGRSKGGPPVGYAASMDVDSLVGAWCRENGRPIPDDPDEKISIHIPATEAWFEKMMGVRR